MLKLRKSGQRAEIYLQSPERRLSPDFLKGLLIATVFHVLLFSIVRIATLHPEDESALLPFTEVFAELGEKMTTVQVSPLQFQLSLEEGHPTPTLGENLFVTRPLIEIDYDPDFSSVEMIPYYSPLEADD